MLKRVDVALHRAISEFVEDDLQPGLIVLGVAESGVGLAESGGFLDRHRAALATAADVVAAGNNEMPFAIGPVIDMAPEPTPSTEVIALFDGATCDFAGLDAIASGEAFAVVVTNSSDRDAFVGFIPVIDESLTFEDLQQISSVASADEVPDHLDLSLAQGAMGPPGIRTFIATLGTGHWGAYCSASGDSGNQVFPAALLELG